MELVKNLQSFAGLLVRDYLHGHLGMLTDRQIGLMICKGYEVDPECLGPELPSSWLIGANA